jgi:hypothetical protein
MHISTEGRRPVLAVLTQPLGAGTAAIHKRTDPSEGEGKLGMQGGGCRWVRLSAWGGTSILVFYCHHMDNHWTREPLRDDTCERQRRDANEQNYVLVGPRTYPNRREHARKHYARK